MARHTRHNTDRLWLMFMALAITIVWMAGCQSYPNCDTDDDCKGYENEYCLNKLCAQCRQNDHCERSFQCVGGACEKILDWCESSNDCTTPGKPACRNNRCGPECLSDSDCTNGKICKEDGTCQVQCVVDSDCPGSNDKCMGGRCVAQKRIVDPCDNLAAVYFDYNESALTSTSRESLRNHAECVKNRNQALQLEGHCDERGTPEYNIALGERRARSARDYMVSLGVARNKLSMISYGEERPAKYGTGESVWGLNRRCEFVWK